MRVCLPRAVTSSIVRRFCDRDHVSRLSYVLPLIGICVAIWILSPSHLATAVASTVSPAPDGHGSFDVEPSSRYVKVNGSSPGFCVIEIDSAPCLMTIGSSKDGLTLAAGAPSEVPGA